MCITTASRAILIVAGGALALTVGVANAKSERDVAMRNCMAKARMGMPMGARPSLGIKRRQTIAYNECMERAGFPPGHAKTR